MNQSQNQSSHPASDVNTTDRFALEHVTIQLHPQDNVALAKIQLPADAVLVSESAGREKLIPVRETIPLTHKVALTEISAGQPVRRYGQTIGFASQTIRAGEWVHTHNVSIQGVDRDYAFGVDTQPVTRAPEHERRTFQGYRRSDGRVGTRNYVAVISSVVCSAHATRMIARHFTAERLGPYPNIDGVIALTHLSGCGLNPEGPVHRQLQRTLAGIARHPNVGAYFFVGLGCETNQISELLSHYELGNEKWNGPGSLIIQELGGTGPTIQAGVQAVEHLLPIVNQVQRTPQPLSELTLALHCGGSDGWSGVTANPTVGLVADELVRQGGTVLLAETPEVYGAEHLLTRRAISPEVGKQLLAFVDWWEAHTEKWDTQLNFNATPGNKAGGLTTIYEKALGAIAKSGTTPLTAVYDYAEPVTARGFTFMNSPGNDTIGITGQMAGGAQVVIFTTGRGSVIGFKPTPCIKVSSNSATYRRMEGDMDVNAGQVLEGVPMDQVAAELLDLVVEVASGQSTKSEVWDIGENEFSPWLLDQTV